MALEIGEKAPDFELPDSGGKKVGLPSFAGRRVVVYFYPKDDKHYVTIFFLGEYIGGKPKEMEPDKISNWTWYKIADLKNMQDQLWEPCIDKFKKLGWI